MARWSPRTSGSHSSGDRPSRRLRRQVEAGRPPLRGLEQRGDRVRLERELSVALVRSAAVLRRRAGAAAPAPRRGRRRAPRSAPPGARPSPSACRAAVAARSASPPPACAPSGRFSSTSPTCAQASSFCTSWASSSTSTNGGAPATAAASPGRTRSTSGGRRSCSSSRISGSTPSTWSSATARQRSSTRGSLSLPSSRSQIAGRLSARSHCVSVTVLPEPAGADTSTNGSVDFSSVSTSASRTTSSTCGRGGRSFEGRHWRAGARSPRLPILGRRDHASEVLRRLQSGQIDRLTSRDRPSIRSSQRVESMLRLHRTEDNGYRRARPNTLRYEVPAPAAAHPLLETGARL